MAAFRCSEQPTLPSVYEVLVNIHGVIHPKPHEPKLYAYHDGIDTWNAWEFSEAAALRAPTPRLGRSIKYVGWREVTK